MEVRGPTEKGDQLPAEPVTLEDDEISLEQRGRMRLLPQFQLSLLGAKVSSSL